MVAYLLEVTRAHTSQPRNTTGRFDMTQTAVREVPALDFKVADLALAEWGRKEIGLAEHEMPGLDVGAARVRRRAAACAARASPARCT